MTIRPGISTAIFLLAGISAAGAQPQDLSGAAVQPGLVEEQSLESTEEIVTEEDYVLGYVNYRLPPETTEATPLVTAGELRLATEIDLNKSISALEEALQKCIDMREAIEARIGDIPGSRNVDTGWPVAYNNCILQVHRDGRTISDVLTKRRMQIVASGQDEGATLLTSMIDRLITRHSAIKRRISAEMNLVPLFFAYYNTGVRDY